MGGGQRWVQSVFFKILGRPTQFLGSVQFLTAPMLDRLIGQRPVTALRVLEPYPPRQQSNRVDRWLAWYVRALGVRNQQYLFLLKQPLQSTKGQGS